VQLFDMDRDRAELEDLAGRAGDVAAELAAALAEFERTTVRLEGAAVEVALDDELMDDLEALGYAGEDGD